MGNPSDRLKSLPREPFNPPLLPPPPAPGSGRGEGIRRQTRLPQAMRDVLPARPGSRPCREAPSGIVPRFFRSCVPLAARAIPTCRRGRQPDAVHEQEQSAGFEMAVDEAVHLSLFGMGQMMQRLDADDRLQRRGGEGEDFDVVEVVANQAELRLLQPLFRQAEHGRGRIHAHHPDVWPKAKQPLFHLSGSDAQIQNRGMGTQPSPEKKKGSSS